MNKVIHYVGLDVHKESIAVAIAPQHATEVRRYGIIGGSLDAVDKLLRKLGGENLELRVVYEAGPCGFVLCRHLRSQGIHCDVVSPSLVPKKASDRVNTDRRDAEQLLEGWPGVRQRSFADEVAGRIKDADMMLTITEIEAKGEPATSNG